MTDIEIETIAHRRIDDTAYRMMREGVDMDWTESAAISDAGHQWLGDRLGLVSTTDSDGVHYRPRVEVES